MTDDSQQLNQTDRLRTRITAAVVTHADYIADGIRHCTCGEWSGDSQTTRIGFAAHVVEAAFRGVLDDCVSDLVSSMILNGSYHVTDQGAAVIESGLTVWQAHEIKYGCSRDKPCEKCRSYGTAYRFEGDDE